MRRIVFELFCFSLIGDLCLRRVTPTSAAFASASFLESSSAIIYRTLLNLLLSATFFKLSDIVSYFLVSIYLIRAATKPSSRDHMAPPRIYGV